MRWIVLIIFLSIALILESTVTTIPLVFVVLLAASVVYKKTEIIIIAAIVGLLLDILRLQTVGLVSIFFLSTLTLAFLYERKFEIQSIPFVLVFSFLSSVIYSFIFVHNNILLSAVSSCLTACLLFLLFQFINNLLHTTVE